LIRKQCIPLSIGAKIKAQITRELRFLSRKECIPPPIGAKIKAQVTREWLFSPQIDVSKACRLLVNRDFELKITFSAVKLCQNQCAGCS